MFKKLLRLIAMILVIVALIYLCAGLLVKYGLVQAATLSFMNFGGILTLATFADFFIVAGISAALGFLISPSAAGAVVKRVGSAIGSVAEAVGSTIGGVVSGVAGGLITGAAGGGLGSILVIGIGAFVAYKYFTRPQQPDQPPAQRVEQNVQPT